MRMSLVQSRRSALACHAAGRRAFTLVELLVVIAIIALLVSLLLVGLRKARDTAKSTVCHSNMKQIATALHSYAHDNKMTIWEAGFTDPPRNLYRFWYAVPRNQLVAGNDTTNPLVIGPAFEYLGNADKVFECPTNKRRTRTAFQANPNDNFWQQPQNRIQLVLWNNLLAERAMNFDYTMVTGAGGAPLGLSVFAAWDTRCTTRLPQSTIRQPSLPASTPQLQQFHSIPIFVEEDPYWWNAQSPDGLFSNWDQITDVHNHLGHMAFLDGSAIPVKVPFGPDPNTQNDAGDLTANDFYVSRGGNNLWYMYAPSWPGPPTRPFGWLKSPR